MSETKLAACPFTWESGSWETIDKHLAQIEGRGREIVAVCQIGGSEFVRVIHRASPAPALTPKQQAAEDLYEALLQSQWGLIEIDDEVHVEGCKRCRHTALDGHSDSCPTGAALAAYEKAGQQ